MTLGAAGALLRAQAQSRAEVGWLSYGDINDPNLSAFINGLRRLGWREEANLTVVPQFAQTMGDLVAHADDLLSRDLRVLVTVGLAATRIAKARTTRLPIIFGSVVDVVGNGILNDPNRPEGNLTGVVYLDETIPKLMELAKELRPQTKVIAHFFEPIERGPPISRELADTYSEAAHRLGLEYRQVPIDAFEAFRRGLDKAVAEGCDAAIVDNAGFLQYYRVSIVRYTLGRGIAPIGRERLFATAGGLASFGEEGTDLYRRAAAHV